MVVRELPWSSGRFFEIDSCNVVLQPIQGYKYFIIKCHCHESPELHVPAIAQEFGIANYRIAAPFSREWLHVIEQNKPGKVFFEALEKSSKKNNDCISPKICSA
jgi:hypothetical protein